MDEGPGSEPISLATYGGPIHPWAPLTTGIGAFCLIVLIGIGAFLFAPSDAATIQPPLNVDSLPYADGVLVEVDLPRLVMDAYEPLDGDSEIEFTVRDRDLQYFDVVHLRAHSAIGLPTRVYYEKDGDNVWALYKEDAPANSASEKGE